MKTRICIENWDRRKYLVQSSFTRLGIQMPRANMARFYTLDGAETYRREIAKESFTPKFGNIPPKKVVTPEDEDKLGYAMVQHYIMGVSQEQIAKEIGMPQSTISIRSRNWVKRQIANAYPHHLNIQQFTSLLK